MSPRFLLDGKDYDRSMSQLAELAPDERARIAGQAVFFTAAGALMEEPTLSMVRDKVRGSHDGLRSLLRRDERELPPDLIPGLWPWGTHPMLGAPPKVGKSTLVAELVPALAMRERPFLDHFAPANRNLDPRVEGNWLNVAIVNAEMDAAGFEDMLMRAFGDEVSDDDWPTIYHLRELGGPAIFDLTDPDNFRMWADVLTECFYCDGADTDSASVLIVDGLTAVLASAGKGTEHYGLWYAAYRQLLEAVEIPTSLTTGHTTLKGDHLMNGVESMAGPDGLWKLTRGRGGLREFSVPDPRHPAPKVDPIPLLLTPEGRLRARPRQKEDDRPSPAAEPVDLEAVILAFVASEHEEGRHPSGNEVLRSIGGRTDDVLGSLARLVDASLLSKRPRSGRGGGSAYWPADAAPPST